MRKNKRFNKKVIVVTGSAQGIGEGVAEAIAAEGGMVVLADRSNVIKQVAKRIKSNKGECAYILCDLETYAGAKELMAFAIKKYGHIDVLINNVGGTIWAKPFEEYEEQQIIAEINRSLFPTLWCCRAVLPHMIERQQGNIVNVSSIATRSIHRIPYSASKGGVNTMTASLAFEYAKDGIRVNAVATGGTIAPPRVIPRNKEALSKQEEIWYQGIVDQTIATSYMHRYGTIAEQVHAILFLASDESSYITGSVLPVGGGDQG